MRLASHRPAMQQCLCLHHELQVQGYLLICPWRAGQSCYSSSITSKSSTEWYVITKRQWRRQWLLVYLDQGLFTSSAWYWGLCMQKTLHKVSWALFIFMSASRAHYGMAREGRTAKQLWHNYRIGGEQTYLCSSNYKSCKCLNTAFPCLLWDLFSIQMCLTRERTQRLQKGGCFWVKHVCFSFLNHFELWGLVSIPWSLWQE